MKKDRLLLWGGIFLLMGCRGVTVCEVTPTAQDLTFAEAAPTWDEGIPLGNATVGVLVWQKDSSLRFSLDRTDLWDLRPSDSLSGDRYRFSWVKEQIRKNDYLPVQKKFDWPYDRDPAPSKIPGAALEFSLKHLGAPDSVHLYLDNALCEVNWKNGVRMQTFVHATEPVGWFAFYNLKDSVLPQIVPPVYDRSSSDRSNDHSGPDLERLGYKQGKIMESPNRIVYHQPGWGDFHYDVVVEWERRGDALYGVWSVTTSLSADQAVNEVEEAMQRGMNRDYGEHLAFWKDYWKASSVNLPDPVLQKQYDNEMYKFGSAAREDSYPISLQAVWTADNGKLPPWKGDYHHDLNTELSYWPAYTGNHLKEGMGYLNTIWNQCDTYRKWTRQYFETEGLNVPGVATLTGEPMGGWIQYSMSQTTGAWIAHHFYLHWKYSADKEFLKEKGYPFVRDVATFLEQISKVDESTGVRRLEFSSSPEIFDNSIQAWFKTMTNYDLSLMTFIYRAASEMADALQLSQEAAHWREIGSQLPKYDLADDGSLTFAKGFPYEASHRHFSHAMAIHPLGLIDWSDGPEAQRIIRATVKRLDQYGPDYWTGYSYAWLGNMKARMFDGEGAAKALRTFAECFCLKNTFHANGDQSGTGKSLFTYRPFTLEGNFAFAAGVQEMLLQSHTDVIQIFPAIPADWKDVSFEQLRAMGGVLVSASMKNGKVNEVRICSEVGGDLTLGVPKGMGQRDTIQVHAPKGKWISVDLGNR